MICSNDATRQPRKVAGLVSWTGFRLPDASSKDPSLSV